MSELIKTRILTALVKLQGQTKTYGKSTDDAIAGYVQALAPFDKFALLAITAWPLEHTEWPALKELVDSARFIQDQYRAQNAVDAATSGGTPVAQFIQAVTDSPAGGRKYVASWLNSTVNCAFTDNAILTTQLGVERLRRDWGKVLGKFGVRVEYDEIQDERLTMHVEGLYQDGKLRRPA